MILLSLVLSVGAPVVSLGAPVDPPVVPLGAPVDPPVVPLGAPVDPPVVPLGTPVDPPVVPLGEPPVFLAACWEIWRLITLSVDCPSSSTALTLTVKFPIWAELVTIIEFPLKVTPDGNPST